MRERPLHLHVHIIYTRALDVIMKVTNYLYAPGVHYTSEHLISEDEQKKEPEREG